MSEKFSVYTLTLRDVFTEQNNEERRSCENARLEIDIPVQRDIPSTGIDINSLLDDQVKKF